ncbi:D-amino-acid transaminase [Marinivivus vitaminiproducens]|uniref:D-amino-acid transaminase n=1 Tax=Marinivivus vitaminiproducens TaxID=3035935 RepID=UPI002799A512|nr:D-amino-acid transaminase [Geminicoccaceae bacterium SCSIO 64248]
MARIAYVNGRYRPIDEAAVGVEERGFQFSDGVYEVVKFVKGAFSDLDRHMARLGRSLDGLRIAWPMTEKALRLVLAETVRRNGLRDALVYIQVSRGVAPRNHLFPKGAPSSLVVTVRRPKAPGADEIENGVAVCSQPDIRWGRCDIKSVSLLANVLARQAAQEQGAREAWLVDEHEGVVTEGSSSNAYIVDREGRLRTHPLGEAILGGVTRSVILEMARADGITVDERAFTLEEAKQAREAFLTSTSSFVTPVTRIDDHSIGNGHPGSVTRRLIELYNNHLVAC